MDATVKLTLGKDGCQHVMAEITIDKEIYRVTKTRAEWEEETTDLEGKFAVVEANISAYLKAEKEKAGLDWATASSAINRKVFKV